MQVDLRETLLETAKEPLVVVEAEVRMDAALQQNPGAPGGYGLGHLGVDFRERVQVGVGVVAGFVKRAEAAPVDAHVGVVDVAIDDVGRFFGGVFASPHDIRRLAKLEEPTLVEEGLDLMPVERLACYSLVEQRIYGLLHHLSQHPGGRERSRRTAALEIGPPVTISALRHRLQELVVVLSLGQTF